jgi:thiamine pyrophosphate-dependent acetolactate synthase large subunit-like protein
MRYQAELGDVDFITGDYLAEVNIAENAQAHAAGNHPGWEQTAWDGIEQTIDLLNEKRLKVVVNGGAHNPRGLAEKVQELVSNLKIRILITSLTFCWKGNEQRIRSQSSLRARRQSV